MDWRRRILLGVSLAAVVAIATTLVIRHLEQNRVIHRGSVVVAVEGRDLGFPRGSDGVGTGGLLGLVKGKCVGFVQDPRWVKGLKEDLERSESAKSDPAAVARIRKQLDELVAAGPDSGTVIVWPAGTKFHGEGEDLRITSQGRTVRLGQYVEGGNEFGHDLSGIKDQLPRECRSMRLMRVGLGQ